MGGSQDQYRKTCPEVPSVVLHRLRSMITHSIRTNTILPRALKLDLLPHPAFFLTLPKPPMEAAQQLYRHLEVEHTTVAGGDEWEFFERIQPGDVITSRSRLVDTYEKQGRPGLMLFLVTETTYTNQRDEMVVRARSTIITY